MTCKPTSDSPLCELAIKLPVPAGGLLSVEDLSAGDDSLAAVLSHSPSALALIRHIAAGSPFLTGLVRRDPAFCAQALSEPPQQVFDEVCRLAQDQSDAGSETDIIRNLRIARNRMALLVAMADIAGAWDCQTVTAALTRFADTSLQAATGFVFAQAAQGPKFDRRRRTPIRNPVLSSSPWASTARAS
jgi:glutamate-ammonia-ligase adenylyltransferase